MNRLRNWLLCFACLSLSAGYTSISAHGEDRTYNGTNNNLVHSNWGAAGTNLERLAGTAYDDGFSTPRGGLVSATPPNPTLPNVRTVSNTVVAQSVMVPNTHRMTGWVYQWGQFVDHDIDLTVTGTDPVEEFDIIIPPGDEMFSGVMSFQRSRYDSATGTGPDVPRQQINEITSFLDASAIYGSDESRALTLRSMTGGRLKSSAGNLLPLNTFGLPNATGGPADPTQFYVSGDIRANEQIGLTAVHTLFMREHNRLVDEIAAANPGWSDEQVFQRARKFVGAEMQAITYQEFLPALLGSSAPGVESSYDAGLDPTILNEFSTALYRVGHTMLSPTLLRVQNDGTPAPDGHMPLRDAFFVPQNLDGTNELELFLKGLACDQQQEVDMHLVDDVRNFLFGDPIPGGFDLAALNIQRGRDHGLPGYNAIRVAFGLPAVTSFAEISSDPEVQAGLQSLYGDVNNIDAWVGALSEDHLPDAAVGPLVAAGMVEQFRRIRDGDRFWFTRDEGLSPDDIAWLKNTRLSDVILRNTAITDLQGSVFFMVPEPLTTSLWLMAGVWLITTEHRRRLAR
jgi:peroxidase